MSQQKVIIDIRRIVSSQTSILIMLLAATSLIGSQILISGPLNTAYGETGIGRCLQSRRIDIRSHQGHGRYRDGCNG